ncbi:MAG: hypothetical protein WCF94_03000 [bacterium]
MQLTEEQLNRFKELVKSLYGYELTQAEALDQCIQLVLLHEVVLKEMAEKLNREKVGSETALAIN